MKEPVLTESEIVALRNRLLEDVGNITKVEHSLLHALEDLLMLDFGYEPLIWQKVPRNEKTECEKEDKLI